MHAASTGHTASSGLLPIRRSRFGRFGAMALLAVLFAGAATTFGPFGSSARHRGDLPAIVRADGPVLIGRVVARDHCLLAYASARGVTYTVTTAGGRILRVDLGAEDVYRMYPDLDPAALHTRAMIGPLMMVESED